ncbi:M28 family peptidase [Nonomuraea aurantiaca]|uniref:M28 family peptidase n=1 Tax=Nonomuraea aurantiaca TaxID=2878562 RepID=UPI001CD95707|nr:M28 family peptidase [Nonomuraea aurantiaca]MCA2223963.1 M28 family peptidase [Nonomuraea aurantiaca]
MDHVPSAAEMLGWIETVVSRGIRRPGYPADAWTERWLAERLTEFGLEVSLEPVEVPRWQPGTGVLRLDDGTELTGFPLPHTLPTDGLRARIAPLADARPGDIAVDELAFTELPQSYVSTLATSSYDPEGVFDTLVQTLPFGPRMMEVVEPALEAGAAGFIGALTGLPWETRDYYVPYDAIERPIPALWLSASDARRLLARLPCTGELVAQSVTDTVTTHNVVATLPGGSPHTVIVGSHHDGPWASAVEDASGIALVLAAARHWAAVPVSARPHNLTFLLTSGHMAHAAGTRAFIERHRSALADVVLQLHLEHAALRCETVDGELVPTADPEVRWWFTSRVPRLEKLVAETLAEEGLRRSFVLPPDVFSPMPPTDGAFFHPEGVPLVHFLSAPMYLFDSADTLDKIDVAGLEPLARAAVRIVAGTAGWAPQPR